jgi:hypothetical protein
MLQHSTIICWPIWFWYLNNCLPAQQPSYVNNQLFDAHCEHDSVVEVMFYYAFECCEFITFSWYSITYFFFCVMLDTLLAFLSYFLTDLIQSYVETWSELEKMRQECLFHGFFILYYHTLCTLVIVLTILASRLCTVYILANPCRLF